MGPGSPPPDRATVRVGISSCLLGNRVRYDGGHKRDHFLTEVFGRFVEWVPVCPEVEAGMGIPRPPLRLVWDGDGLRMVETGSGRDWTAAMAHQARRRVRDLSRMGLRGFVLKAGSPSCGMQQVPVHAGAGMAERSGRGLFARELLHRLAPLPVEEEGRLGDPDLCEHFAERVFAFDRLQALFARDWSRADMVRFHAAHRYQLLVHSPRGCERLDCLMARIEEWPRGRLREAYEAAFMEALRHRATPARHARVLHQMARAFRGLLDPASRAALRQVIGDYRRGLVPRAAVLALLRRHAVAHGIEALAAQSYLAPYPSELMLHAHRVRGPAGIAASRRRVRGHQRGGRRGSRSPGGSSGVTS